LPPKPSCRACSVSRRSASRSSIRAEAPSCERRIDEAVGRRPLHAELGGEVAGPETEALDARARRTDLRGPGERRGILDGRDQTARRVAEQRVDQLDILARRGLGQDDAREPRHEDGPEVFFQQPRGGGVDAYPERASPTVLPQRPDDELARLRLRAGGDRVLEVEDVRPCGVRRDLRELALLVARHEQHRPERRAHRKLRA
jgi:hypothetical protein